PNFASIPNPKFNEEVVKLLNGLGYPYNLKNSTMQTMTTPSMWPTMLAVLEWLVNFVELEQTLHDDMRVGDQEKWQLYVSCYKKKLEMRAASAPSVKFDHDLFAAEFETYRNSKLGIDGDESFDELRSRRIAFGEELDRIRMLIAKVLFFNW
uniref:Kinetochore protein NDC80 n=1 Tax=Meloidogyne javanica TaxID=6303 RepID=A0A915MSG6_MELJA